MPKSATHWDAWQWIYRLSDASCFAAPIESERFMLGAIREALVETRVTDEPANAINVGARSRAQSDRVVIALKNGQLSMAQLALALDLRSKTGALIRTVHDLLEAEIVEYTIPAKPTSRLQKYRLTAKGRKRLK